MEQKPVVLLVNHRELNCGVQQYGQKIFLPLLNSTSFRVYYIDIETIQEFYYWRDYLQPQIIIFNYYNQTTMPWLTHDLLNENRVRGIKQATIHHEGTPATGFDLIIDQDPTGSLGVDSFPNVRIPRPIPPYNVSPYNVYRLPESIPTIPIISSFGFGLGGKGFQRVVQTVVDQLPEAVIRLNIPFAKFGDEQGLGALAYFKACNDIIRNNTRYKLILTYELMPQEQLLEWLGESTINCFFYDENYGRGISGTLDYCLAVKKPIAITQSWQFKHIWSQNTKVLIEQNTLPEIISAGIIHLRPFYDQWNTQTLIQMFEDIFRRLLHAF